MTNRRSLANARLGLALAAALFAAACGSSGPPAPEAAARSYEATGRVEWVSVEQGNIKIDHEEIVGLMPAMSMRFVVRDKNLLVGVEPQSVVDFTVVEETRGYVITSLRRRNG